MSCGLTESDKPGTPAPPYCSVVWCWDVCDLCQPSEAAWGWVEGFWVLEYAFVLIVVMVSRGCANVRIFQIAHYIYVQFIVHQKHLNRDPPFLQHAPETRWWKSE